MNKLKTTDQPLSRNWKLILQHPRLNPRWFLAGVPVVAMVLGIWIYQSRADSIVTVHGLNASYFANQTLSSPAALTRVDGNVNFDWSQNTPASGIPADHFSVLWTGQLQAPTTATYKIVTTSDDGVRVWVNGQLIVNSWTDHGKMENSGSIRLQGGQKYPLRVEFYENLGSANVSLQWSAPGLAQQVIPNSALYTTITVAAASGTPTPTPVPTNNPLPSPTPSASASATPSAGGFVSMPMPSYSGSTWAASNITNDEHFQNLNNWNYGIGGSQSCSTPTSCGYYPWWPSGTAPYYGGALAPAHVSNYDVPGNVSQTSTGVNTSLFNGYSPQTFSSTGWGLTFTGHYSSTPRTYSINGTNYNFNWTSGALNTFNKVYFPSGTYKSFYVQLKAQTMGYNGSNNGAWNGIWLLGQGNGSRELDLQETGICGQSPNLFCSNIQDPSSTIVNNNSGQNLSAGYHIYGIEYNRSTGVTSFYLDNQLKGSVTQAAGAGPYYLLLDGDIGNGFAGAIKPASNVDMAMKVMQVQVYQR